MKLIDRKKLDMYLDKICWTPEDKAAVFKYCELDPADLELAVLGAWGELETKITEEWRIARGSVDRYGRGYRAGLGYALGHLRKLESGLDPKKLRAMREKAAYLDMLYGDFCNPSVHPIRDVQGYREVLRANMYKRFYQAQADLKTPDKPFAKAQDKPKEETGETR